MADDVKQLQLQRWRFEDVANFQLQADIALSMLIGFASLTSNS